jgi:hypothetical protein
MHIDMLIARVPTCAAEGHVAPGKYLHSGINSLSVTVGRAAEC